MDSLRAIEYDELTDNEKVLFHTRIFIVVQKEEDYLTGEEIERELTLYPEDLLN